jgi:hypothetical protein
VLEFAMLRPSCVGEELSAAGVVTAKHDGERPTVELDVWIDADGRRTVQGSAVLAY